MLSMIMFHVVIMFVLTLQFAHHGSILVLWDINKAKLLETCSQLTSQGHEAFAYVVDCSKREKVYQAAERVKQEVGNVSVLVNNAGIVNTKSILDLTDEDIVQEVNINFLAHYWVRVNINNIIIIYMINMHVVMP